MFYNRLGLDIETEKKKTIIKFSEQEKFTLPLKNDLDHFLIIESIKTYQMLFNLPKLSENEINKLLSILKNDNNDKKIYEMFY